MIIKEIHKFVMKEIGSFLVENGFAKQNSSSWVRCTDEMIQMIILHFSYGQEKFDLDVVVQPWCIPEKKIYLTLSTRLSKLDSRNEYHSWGALNEKNLINDIDDVKMVIKKDLFPILKNSNDCLSSLSYVDTTLSSIFRVDLWNKSRTFAYVFFYKHKIDEASIWAQKYLSLIEDYSNDDIESDIIFLNQLLLFSKEKNYERIDELFITVIEKNKQNFKLNCLNKKIGK